MSDSRLVSLAKRINAGMDRIEEERAHVRDIYVEAKSAGYIPKMLRKAIARQRMDASKREEEDSILDLYDHALGNLGKALEAISEGATWEEAGKANGVPRATLARAAAVSKRREVIPDASATVSAPATEPTKATEANGVPEETKQPLQAAPPVEIDTSIPDFLRADRRKQGAAA